MKAITEVSSSSSYNGGLFFDPRTEIREFRGVELELHSTPWYSSREKVSGWPEAAWRSPSSTVPSLQ